MSKSYPKKKESERNPLHVVITPECAGTASITINGMRIDQCLGYKIRHHATGNDVVPVVDIELVATSSEFGPWDMTDLIQILPEDSRKSDNVLPENSRL